MNKKIKITVDNIKKTRIKCPFPINVKRTKQNLRCQPMIASNQFLESVAMTYVLVEAPIGHRQPTIVRECHQFSGCAPWFLCIKVASHEWLDGEFGYFHLRINLMTHQ